MDDAIALLVLLIIYNLGIICAIKGWNTNNVG